MAALERVVARARQGGLLPGLSAAFASREGRVGAAVAGHADVEAEVPMTPETRFIAGSVGKSLHAAHALLLHREGIVDLDAPVSRWLGDEPWFGRLPNAEALTLRALLQHTSGIADHLKTPGFWIRSLVERLFEQEEALFSPEELIEPVLDREPGFPVGEGFAYGDTNYVLAGLVVERATGASAFDGIEERLLGPLALDGIVAARARHVPGLAAGYQAPVNPFLLPPKIAEGGTLRVHPMNESTAGGFATTPSGVVRWAKALFEGPALRGPEREALVGRTVPTGDGRHYGLGVYVQDTPRGRAFGHGGYFPGYRSGFLYFPDSGVAVCVQVNRDVFVDVDALLLEIARAVIPEP